MNNFEKELLEALRMTSQALAWLAHGECRGYHPKLPTAADALAAARDAIAKCESASIALIQEEPTNSFVQSVPDKCDRIVWRGRYIHLKE